MRNQSAHCVAGLILCSVSLLAQNTVKQCAASPELEAERRTNRSAEFLSAVGYWFIEQNQPACAIQLFESAIRTDPDFLEARYNLGLILAETGQLQKAIEQLKVAVRLSGNDPNVQTTLNAVVAQQKKQVAASTPPPSTDFSKALQLIDQKRYTEARNLLSESLKKDPRNPDLLTAMGMTLTRMRLLDDAVKVLRQVVTLKPGSADAHMNLGVALADLSNQAEALKHFNRAVQISPSLAMGHYYRGRALHELKRETEAEPALRTALKLDPSLNAAKLTLASALNQSGRPQEAIPYLQQYMQTEPGNPLAFFEMGQALVGSGKADEAITAYRKALELEPNHSQSAYALLQILMQRKSPEVPTLAARVRELKRGELAVTQARVLSNFGLDAANEKNWSQAVIKLQDALKACGRCAIRPALQKNLGLVLARSGDIAAAKRELEVAKSLDPQDRDIEFALELLTTGSGQ